jgi:CHAT domain-containing protein
VTEFLRFRANVLNQLGKTDLALAQIDSILNHFEPNTFNIEETYVFKGDIYAQNKNLDSTLYYYTKAIKFMHNSTDSLKSDFSNYASRYQYINDAKQLEYMSYKLMDKFTEEEKAIAYSNFINNIAYNEFLEGHKNLDLSIGNKQLFYKILNNKLYLNKEEFDDKKAFVTNIENINNAFAWRKFSQSRNIVQFPLIDSLENIEYNLRKQIVAAKKERLSKREDSLQIELSNLHSVIAEDYPILANYTQNNFRVTEFQNQLNSNEIVLKYLFFYDQFVIISISKNDILFDFRHWKSAQKDLVKSHLKLLEKSGSSMEVNPELTALLLPESAFNFESIIVVPDTPIYNLPFETLSYNSDYLIKEKAIHYSSHLRFVRIPDSANKQAEPKSTIFAPEYASESTQLVTRSEPVFLEGAQKEAKWLENLFPSESFIGEKATKINFIENKTKGNILHLAMHASVDEEDPSFSHFNFANDEKLYLEELYALKIPADLAVLSACNTGIGKEDGTSSMASLQRAFNYAGTTATIASLWEVPDETTSEIMIAFYEYLKDGETKSSALQKAKIDYLNNTTIEKLKHPYYWAGFVLYGDDAPVVESSDNLIRYVLGISILLIIFIIFKKWKKT